jgi:hypothetical protein
MLNSFQHLLKATELNFNEIEFLRSGDTETSSA